MPENILNVYEQVERNKLRSALVIVGFIFFVVGFVWLVGQILQTDSSLIVAAIVFSLGSSLTGYFWGDKIILTLSRARQVSKKEYFDLYTVTENLCLAAQIPFPKIYVIKSPAMNAFATGRDPKHAVVCATTGLIEKLNRSELEAVIAHEISHIVGYDIRLMTIVAILVGMVTLLSDWIWRTGRSSGNSRRQKGNPLNLIIGLPVLVLTPLVAKLIQLAISRSREYLADASAVKLTRQPQELINALKKLKVDNFPLRSARSATAHLYITNPFKGSARGLSRLNHLFSTHPPLENRISALEKMI